MVANLIRQLGLSLADLVDYDNQFLISSDDCHFGVFHIENAEDSPYIPDQKKDGC
ncbi:MAG: hypothetical protein MK132_02300 [Lentisphaerales bacterium]|nr:hypothetical protein [Lentisphaerales bacterium]